MKAVILAAGVNARLKKLCKAIPKCLLKVGDTSIVDYQIKLLTFIGNLRLQDIFIIGGYKIEQFDYLKDLGIHVIYNPKFEEFNNIYSFYLAKDLMDEDFILLNGDTFADQKIMEFLVKSNHETAFVVDNIKKLGWEEMKVLLSGSKILRFGKKINPKNAHGEYIGFAKFGLRDAIVVFDCMEKLLCEGKTNIWYENAINYVLDKVNAFAIHTNGLPWIEIDTPRDYEKAKELESKLLNSGVFHR